LVVNSYIVSDDGVLEAAPFVRLCLEVDGLSKLYEGDDAKKQRVNHFNRHFID